MQIIRYNKLKLNEPKITYAVHDIKKVCLNVLPNSCALRNRKNQPCKNILHLRNKLFKWDQK